MKFFPAILFLFLQTTSLFTQSSVKPEAVYSITKTHFSYQYYKDQAIAWQELTLKTPKDANAWLNFFTAARMNNMLAPNETDFRYDIGQIIEKTKQEVPGTFEANYVQFWQLNHSKEGHRFLQKAYELAPDRFETWHDLITKAELERDTTSIRKFSKKWYNSKLHSPSLTTWNYNVLMSLSPGAIVLTHGDNDTYPLWLLQYVKNIRRDVTVLNASLLSKKNYRDKIFAEVGLPAFKEKEAGYTSSREYIQDIAEHVLFQAERPVFLSISSLPSLRKKYIDQFYLVGLAFQFSKEEFDHVAVMRHNFEQKFFKDYLAQNLQPEFSDSVVRFMNQHYIPCLTVLYKHYRLSGESNKAMKTRELLLKVAESSGREKEIQEYLVKWK